MGINTSGKTVQEVEKIADNAPKTANLTLVWEEKKYTLAAKRIDLEYRNQKTAQRAWKLGRKGGIIQASQDKWKAITRGVNLPHSISLDSEKLDAEIAGIATSLSIPAVEPALNIKNNKVSVNPGKNGQDVDRNVLKEKILQAFAYGKQANLIPVNKLTPQLSEDQVEILKVRAEKILGKKLEITFERETFTYPQQDLVTILGAEDFILPEKAQALISGLASAVNRQPQNAKFEFAEGKVKEFTPAKDGIKVNEEEALKKLVGAVKKLVETEEKIATSKLPVAATKPETANQDVNNLGINELIGRGESVYRGSIPGRIHNLSLAASRLNGILIKPGEEFSFNKNVGDISQATGYRQAYVIKEGKTILDDGGGVCQTSTTFFRAALNAGLPILERHQHSYRVSYYEIGTKPGYDAAIYLPHIDLRLKNDTSGHILIQTKNDRQNAKLIFEFYGTNDGRRAEILNYRQWDARPSPPDLYQDDPTLPAGTTKQIEKGVPGLKTAFDYKVTRGGETIFEKTFYSNFRPWQAVYLRGIATQ